MRKLALLVLATLFASAITTAAVADYVQRYPTTLLAKYVHRVAGTYSCPAETCCVHPAIPHQMKMAEVQLTPEMALQVAKDLDVSTKLLEEIPAPVVPASFTTDLDIPIRNTSFDLALNDTPAPTAGEPQEPKTCPEPKACANCPAATAVAPKAACQECQACPATQCEQLKVAPRVATWVGPKEGVIEVVVVRPRECQAAPAHFFHSYVAAPLPPLPTCPAAGEWGCVPCPQPGAQGHPHAQFGLVCVPAARARACEPCGVPVGFSGGMVFHAQPVAGTCQECGPNCREGNCCSEKYVAETYPIGQFLDPNEDATPETVMRIISRMVRPETWDMNGGRGAIDYMPIGNVLVVRQTAAVHEEISGLLQKLSTAMQGEVTTAACKDCPAKCSAKMVRRIYPVGDLVALQSACEGKVCQRPEDVLIQHLQGAVACQTWVECGGAATVEYYPLGMCLVIEQSWDVHEQLAQYFDRMREMAAMRVTANDPQLLRCEAAVECKPNCYEIVLNGPIEIEFGLTVDGKVTQTMHLQDAGKFVRLKTKKEGCPESCVQQTGHLKYVELIPVAPTPKNVPEPPQPQPDAPEEFKPGTLPPTPEQLPDATPKPGGQ